MTGPRDHLSAILYGAAYRLALARALGGWRFTPARILARLSVAVDPGAWK